jgi:hypothetical protein
VEYVFGSSRCQALFLNKRGIRHQLCARIHFQGNGPSRSQAPANTLLNLRQWRRDLPARARNSTAPMTPATCSAERMPTIAAATAGWQCPGDRDLSGGPAVARADGLHPLSQGEVANELLVCGLTLLRRRIAESHGGVGYRYCRITLRFQLSPRDAGIPGTGPPAVIWWPGCSRGNRLRAGFHDGCDQGSFR